MNNQKIKTLIKMFRLEKPIALIGSITPAFVKTRSVKKFGTPAAIILVGIVIAIYLVYTKPESKRKPPEKQAWLVETISLAPTDATVEIKAMGTVIPARQVELKPQVSGRVIEIAPDLIPGGTFKKGQILMKIEPNDYDLIIRQRQSELDSARSNFKIELGNQAVAKQEYQLLAGNVSQDDKELMLRKPQLISAQSKLTTAQAKLDQAKLDLRRTVMKSPFNAIINQKYFDLGQVVSPSATLVKLTGTDEYWVEVLMPVDKLKWIKIPDKNSNQASQVKIYNTSAWGANVFKTGVVTRLQADLETSGRMAKLIITIKAPLLSQTDKDKSNLLLLGSYVRVEILGETIKSIYSLDRSLLRQNDCIWLIGSDNRLKISSINIIYRGDKTIITDSIESNYKIITTDLSAPVEGMLLRTALKN
ncbi:MAG: efflux RND transporter periplasmic adaptor subunit [Anaerohalosphaeraceae bacterium]|nr:efflux RND transporter periplasmic adaptor subunit [Anaerohalosphaeraceae bacterium]